jgi:hypothetical protein
MQPPPLPRPIGRRVTPSPNAPPTCPPPSACRPATSPDAAGAAGDGEIMGVIVTDRSAGGPGAGAARRRGKKTRGPWPFVIAVVLGGVAAVPIVLVGLRVIQFLLSPT